MRCAGRWIVVAAIWALGVTTAASAAYPERPVTVIVPFTAGGDADLSARNLAPALQKVIAQSVVVMNRAGASGSIGSQFVKEAKPDGYTLLLARIGSQALLPALQRNLGYSWDDFTFLGLLERNPFVCAVHVDSPYRTFDDLVQAMRKNPGKLNYSTSGPGTILNLGPQMMFDVLKLGPEAAVQIAYKGGGDAALAVLSRDVDFNCGNLTSLIGNLKGGRMRALFTTTPQRWPDIPDVPTVRELGFPNLEQQGWNGYFAPARTPQPIIERLQREVMAAAAVPGLERRILEAGGDPG
ncbi:MAG: tripartite tricarboxylate transporter substrate binding protein, partial [Lautropia sp.]|nr:tripartite tricarboxylate transporter substrate binding protein [Lautropia sp.]